MPLLNLLFPGFFSLLLNRIGYTRNRRTIGRRCLAVKPGIKSDPLYQLLRTENIVEFNKQKAVLDQSQLARADYRGLDLREMDADGLDFSDAYFRGADLRGVDFRNTKLHGASFAEAKVSGCYFPIELTAMELRLSLERGTRLRY